MEKLRKNTAIAIAIIAFLGIITLVSGIDTAIRYFTWPLLILNVLEIVCFTWTILYIANDSIKSNGYFKCAFWTLLLINVFLVLASSHFNECAFNLVAELVCIVCLGLVMIKWKDYGITKWLSLTAIAISLVNAVVMTLVQGDEGEEMEYIHIVGAYSLFFLSSSVMGSYMARMAKKEKSDKR